MMKLTPKQIREITVGAVRTWEEADGIHFSKLSAAQQDAFDRRHPRFAQNGKSTTGIRLDFETDSSFIQYVPLTSGKYELKIDGILTEHIKAEANQAVTYTFADTSKKHRVTLHLPSHGVGGGIRTFELSDGATFKRHSFDRKFLFIGDSITQGWNSDIDTLSYAYLVSDHFNAESIIQGIGGAQYDAETLEQIDFDPDTVLVAYGTNDVSAFPTMDELRYHCTEFLKKVKALYPDAHVYVITPPWIVCEDKMFSCGTIADVRETIRNCAEKFGLNVVDGKAMIPPLPSLFIDNVHPNAIGFSCYAHHLIKALS